MSTPAPMVVNCVAYDRAGRRVAEIQDLAAISDVLAAGDRFVWIGLHEPDDGPAGHPAAGVRPARPGDRGRAQRAPAAEDRDLRRLAVRGGADRAAGRRHDRLRRDACVHGRELSGQRPPRRLAVLRRRPAQRRAVARTAGPGSQLRAVQGARFHRRQPDADRGRLPRRTARAGKRYLRSAMEARRHPPSVRDAARADDAAPHAGAAAGHPRPAHAAVSDAGA